MQGGFKGVCSNPPFGLQKILYAAPSHTFLPFVTGPLALLPLLSIQASAAALCLFTEDRRMNAERVRNFLRCCEERTNVKSCINKSPFHALESSPVVLLVSHCRQAATK